MIIEKECPACGKKWPIDEGDPIPVLTLDKLAAWLTLCGNCYREWIFKELDLTIRKARVTLEP